MKLLKKQSCTEGKNLARLTTSPLCCTRYFVDDTLLPNYNLVIYPFILLSEIS